MVGHLFFVNTVALAQKIGMGPSGFGVLAAILSSGLLLFALAITWGEWQAIGRFCANATSSRSISSVGRRVRLCSVATALVWWKSVMPAVPRDDVG